MRQIAREGGWRAGRRWSAALVAASVFAACPAVAQERVIFERRSPYNVVTVTEDARGLRALFFGDGLARQTVIDPRDPEHLEARYARAVPLAFAIAPAAARMLVVGLGGGVIPSYLHRKLPALAIDAVELDPVVVDVARSHFGFRDDDKLRAIVGDGRRYIEQSGERYDVILLDAFGTDSVPYSLTTVEFLRAVRRATSPGGVVLGNVWGRDRNELYDPMLATYREVFEEVHVLDLDAAINKLVIACPSRLGLTREEAARKARALAASLGLRDDLGAIVERGWRPPGRDGEGAKVLRDGEPPGRR